ncbi:MAG TPA: exosortase A [Noviherbaspirillum sp.]|nr:exosortase A [Noviherbaspirillum sp.]
MNSAAIRTFWESQPERYVALAAGLAAAVALYIGTLHSIVAIWNRSQTYVHGYIILPVSLWLIWRRRGELAKLQAQPYWPALLPLAACGTAWLLADLSGVQVVRQYAFVAMLPLVVLVILGVQMTRAMAFPLCFLMLAVPFGEVFIEPLVKFTADFTVAALQATGIPVLRNGNSFEIPSGSWSVVEACSGVRYLISSFTLGCLFAYLTYRTLLRRLAFIALSIIVPIIANGIRAYLIVLLGHFSGNKLAAGVDHLIYGWVFFGLVMLAMFWIGGMWREEEIRAEAPARPQHRVEVNVEPRATGRTAAAALAAVACMAIWPLYATLAERHVEREQGTAINRFDPRWQRAAPFTGWKPAFFTPASEIYRFYEKGAKPVGVAILLYRDGGSGMQLISSDNHMFPEGERSWRQVASSVRSEFAGGRDIPVRETVIQTGGEKLLVWHGYWIDGRFTASDYTGKLLQARQKLLMRGNEGVAIFLFSPYGENAEDSRAVLRRFLDDNRGLLEAALPGANGKDS